jgi:hypothetical protein
MPCGALPLPRLLVGLRHAAVGRGTDDGPGLTKWSDLAVDAAESTTALVAHQASATPRWAS